MVANAKTTSTTWSFPNSLEIWIRETNSAAFLHYLVFIWTKHCKAIGPPKKAITYIFVPSINNWFWRQLMSILPASCSLLSADAFGYFSRSSVWPLTFESTRTVPATNLLNFSHKWRNRLQHAHLRQNMPGSNGQSTSMRKVEQLSAIAWGPCSYWKLIATIDIQRIFQITSGIL